LELGLRRWWEDWEDWSWGGGWLDVREAQDSACSSWMTPERVRSDARVIDLVSAYSQYVTRSLEKLQQLKFLERSPSLQFRIQPFDLLSLFYSIGF
jgi:hypothetical protein